MNIPQTTLDSLKKRGFKLEPVSIVELGKKKLHVEFSHIEFGGKDFDTATPIFKVTKIEAPEPKPRKPRAKK